MSTIHPSAYWLIIPMAAVAFMVWVLWNFSKDEMRRLRKYRLNPRPIAEDLSPRIEVRDEYSARKHAVHPFHRTIWH